MALSVDELQHLCTGLFSPNISNTRAMQRELAALLRNRRDGDTNVIRFIKQLIVDGASVREVDLSEAKVGVPSKMQIGCLRRLFLSASLSQIAPCLDQDDNEDDTVKFYELTVGSGDYNWVRELQIKMYEWNGNPTINDDKKQAIKDVLDSKLGDNNKWATDKKLVALRQMLVKDIRFKELSPFFVTTTCW